MTGYTVDTNGLASDAPAYRDAADQVRAIYDTLSGKLESEGACRGNDDAGRAFAGTYAGPAPSGLPSMPDHSTSRQSMVDGIFGWAKSYISADEAARAGLSKELGY